MRESGSSVPVRPYELLHIIARTLFCSRGEDAARDLADARLTAVWEAIRADPFVPVTLRCNTESHFAYQNPGTDEDTPEGELFNLKRDLDILQRLGLTPGATRPARQLFALIFERIPSGEGVLYYSRVTGPAWRGSTDPALRSYDEAVRRGIERLFPARPAEERASSKRVSLEAMRSSGALRVRPHHLLCITCSHGSTLQGHPADREEDNQHEILDAVRRDPEVPITLVAGCCTVCPPCPSYDPERNLCEGANGTMMLRDQKKDLDVLQLLGLEYGVTMPARELLARIFASVHSIRQICGFGDGIVRSPEWTFCGNPFVLESRYREYEPYVLGRANRWGIAALGEVR